VLDARHSSLGNVWGLRFLSMRGRPALFFVDRSCMELKNLEHPGSGETKDDYLDWLKAHIQREHNYPAYYLRTETVREDIEGNTVWLGEVEVFGLIGHPEAKRCFTWGHSYDRSDSNGRVVFALERLPIVSAQSALRAQLANDLRSAAAT
jgi:hypothetical protein